ARRIPGVEAAGLVNRLPLVGIGQVWTVDLDNGGSKPLRISADSRSATPGYFDTMGIPLQRGRSFTPQDHASAPGVAVVDERIAQTVWPGQNPIGKRVRATGDSVWLEVIGIVGHIRNDGLDTDQRSQVYWSYLQRPQDRMALVVRGSVPPATL